MTVFAAAALLGAIASDVAGTVALERSQTTGRGRLGVVATVLFVGSLGLYALALADLPAAVAESLFVAIGTGAVAIVAAWTGTPVGRRTLVAISLLVAGVVLVQAGG